MQVNNITKQAFILAAGFGSRMMHLTKNTPKPLIKIFNKSILEINIEQLIAAGFNHIIINCHYLYQKIFEFIDQIANNYLAVKFSVIYEPEILDSGGAIKNALSIIDTTQPLLVVNGDILWLDNKTNTLSQLSNDWDSNLDILMLLSEQHNAVGYDYEGDIELLSKTCIKKGIDYIFTGIQLLNPQIFLNFNKNKFSLSEIYFGDFKVGTTINQNWWLHIGSPTNLQQVKEFYIKLAIN